MIQPHQALQVVVDVQKYLDENRINALLDATIHGHGKIVSVSVWDRTATKAYNPRMTPICLSDATAEGLDGTLISQLTTIPELSKSMMGDDVVGEDF